MTTSGIEYTKGSGNIYKDLNLPDSAERLAKAKLAMRMEEIIADRKLNEEEVAKILGINQLKVSALLNGRLSSFSIEKLIHFLNFLHQSNIR